MVTRLVGAKMNRALPQILPMDLTPRLKDDPKATVPDVRSPAEYQTEHIPDARLEPINEFNASSLADFVDGADLRADHPH